MPDWKRSQEAICSQCDVCFLKLLFNSKIFTEMFSLPLPDIDMFLNIPSTKHPGIPPLSHACLPEHRYLGEHSHPALNIFDKVVVILICCRVGLFFMTEGWAGRERH